MDNLNFWYGILLAGDFVVEPQDKLPAGLKNSVC